jgi:dolichyl-phosphate-mannose-protein mannosyltransferase
MTSQPAGEQRIIGREERVEYRDQDGNLLDESQVASLKSDSKVSFKFKYETRTRLVDADGKEVPGSDGLAPAHPDVEGQNPDTKGVKEDPHSQPANAAASLGSVNKEEHGRAMPASDANEATK